MASAKSSTATTIDANLIEEMKNPNQNRIIENREKYFSINERLMNYAHGGAAADTYTIENITYDLAQINKVFHSAKAPDEFKIDAQTIKQASTLAKLKIQKGQSSLLTFNPLEYAEKLISFANESGSSRNIFTPESQCLKRLSESMSYLYRSTSGLEPIAAALELADPERPPRVSQQQERREGITVKSLERVDDPTASKKEETQSEEIARIFRVLKLRFSENNGVPIPLMEFILDPTCFTTTVQNLFHASFLVRDAHVELSEDEFKVPCIAPVSAKEKENRKKLTHSTQGAFMMNMDIWEELCEVIDREEAMIPNINRVNKRKS